MTWCIHAHEDFHTYMYMTYHVYYQLQTLQKWCKLNFVPQEWIWPNLNLQGLTNGQRAGSVLLIMAVLWDFYCARVEIMYSYLRVAANLLGGMHYPVPVLWCERTLPGHGHNTLAHARRQFEWLFGKKNWNEMCFVQELVQSDASRKSGGNYQFWSPLKLMNEQFGHHKRERAMSLTCH
jgi:hypothetical protein